MRFKRWLSVMLAVTILLMNLPVSVIADNVDAVGEPELLSLSVETAEGEEVPLLGGDTISVNLGSSYSFKAVFTNPTQIEHVYITSTKGSAIRLLEAEWDGTAFTTSGYFNGDEQYIPGQIAVEYIKKAKAISMDDDVDWDSMQKAIGGGVTASVTSDSDENIQATVDLAGLLEAESQVAMNFAINVFDANTGANLDEWLGAYKNLEQLTEYVLDDGKYFLYLDYSDASTYVMILRDTSGNKYIKLLMDSAGNYSYTIKNLSEKLVDVETVSNLSYQYLAIQKDIDELHSQVDSRTDLTGAEKAELNERINTYEDDRLLFALSMTVFPAVVAVSGGTMVGPAMMFNALLGVLNAASAFFWDYRVGAIIGCEPLDTNFINDAHGIPLTRELLKEMGGSITRGGTYYLTETVGDIIIDGVTVTLCKHGRGCKIINNGGSLDVCDCTYEEDMDGCMIGWSLYANVTNNGGSVNIRCGQVSVKTNGMGNVTVSSGTVSSIITESGGKTEILGGTVNQIDNTYGNLHVKAGKISRIENTGGTVTIAGGNITKINNYSGEVTISGGVIKGYDSNTGYGSVNAAIENEAEGTMTITGGNIVGGSNPDGTGAAIYNDGMLCIRSGDIYGGSGIGNDDCISTSGIVEIYGGSFWGRINNAQGGNIAIHDGVFQAVDNNNVANYNGNLTIENGDFWSLGVEDNHNNIETRVSNSKYLSETIIRGGAFFCESGDCVSNTSSIEISSTTIEGGSFYSPIGSCIINSGSMTITDGKFVSDDPVHSQGCIYNFGDGKLIITGGTFLCNEAYECINNKAQYLTITGGTFLAPNGWVIRGKSKCALLVGNNSSIEMNGSLGISESYQLILGTTEGYTGGIAYYDTLESKGVSLTPAALAGLSEKELDKLDGRNEEGNFYRYFRLEGDKRLEGTSSDGVHVEITVRVNGSQYAVISGSGITLLAGTQVWAAAYDENGQMTEIVSGVLGEDNIIRFSKPLKAEMTLFLLDNCSRPIYGQILIGKDHTEYNKE